MYSSLPKIMGIGSDRVEMQTQCWALKTCATMQLKIKDIDRRAGAVLSACNFR